MGNQNSSTHVTCDVTGVQPMARDIVRQTASAWQKHLGPDLITLVAYGSAVKGGAIEGSSDVDVAAFVTPGLLTNGGELPLELAMNLHRDLATIDPFPFRYLQGHVYPRGARVGAGFVPGAYQVVLGSPDILLASGKDLLVAADLALKSFDAPAIRNRLSNALLDNGEGRLFREVRVLSTAFVWPTMYHVACIHEGDGLSAWRRTKPEIVEVLGEVPEIGPSLAAWMQAIMHHHAVGESVPTALAAIEAGATFLDAVARWYRARSISCS
jgi:hypothetical protein